MAIHEAPVYVPGINNLFVGVLEQGYLPQLFVDLNQDPPTLSEFESDPPVYAPNGGTYHGGLVYWGRAGGGNNSIGGTEQRPGIRVLDPTSNKTTTLLNNYFGFYFNGLDDLIVDSSSDIWSTDPDYAWNGNRTDTTPQLHAQTYRFPSFPPVNSGWLKIHSVNPMASPSPLMPKTFTFAILSLVVTVYRYDIVDADAASALINKRPFYYSQEWVPDGVNVAANGFVVAGVGMGVDVIDRTGSLVLQIRTHYIVQNFAW
ncbi:hypothetical protein D6C84_00907 [Aureobasidium pullulans]|uniref:Uncharacterized protein n=1 Tax=Aureobasidium pullulans TaxID=5580 RepID=A0A4S9Y8W4_AURPU|nr:hypothetical protein D6C84_00907 [Aureobasidium pullulans]